MKRRALVLAGGGSAGAWELGALKALLENGRSYDIICGTSVGSLNGTFLAHFKPEDQLKGMDKLLEIWSKIENKTVFKPQAWWILKYIVGLWKGSINTMAPLKEIIDANLDKDQLNASGVDLRVGCCSLNSGKFKAVPGSDPKINEWVYASCIFPAFFEANLIDGELWVDGGIRNAIPLQAALDLHPDEVDVVLTQPSSGYITEQKDNKAFKSYLKVGLRIAEIMSEEVYTNDLLNNSKLKVNIYQPKEIITVPGFEFNQKDIQSMIKTGYEETKQCL